MTARRSARALALLAGAAIAIAACGPAATTAPTGAPSQGGIATPGTDPSFALPSGFPSFALPSFTSDADLEDQIPDEIGGVAVQKFSMTGDSFLGTGGTGSQELETLLTDLGKSPADLSVAFAGVGTLAIVAYRIRDVPSSTFFEGFVDAAQAGGSDVSLSDVSLGGKAVTKIVSTDTDIGTLYVYGSGDVLFLVGGEGITDTQLNETFSKLP